MRISELEASSGIERIWGVEADTPGKTPPEGLQEIGVLARLDGVDISYDVLDTLIYYRVAGLRVILEIPADLPVAPETALMLGASAETEVSLLPPRSDDDVAWQRYAETLRRYARVWLENTNLLTQIHPVSGYFHYLCGHELGYEPATLTTDDYIEARFAMPIPRMESLKVQLEAAFMDHLGGRDGLRELVLAVGAATYEKLGSVVTEIEQRIAAQRAALDQSNAPVSSLAPSTDLDSTPHTNANRTIPIISIAAPNEGLTTTQSATHSKTATTHFHYADSREER